MSLSVGVLVLVTMQRVGELLWARRNTRKLLAKGALEWFPGHYPLIVLVHAAWLGGLWWLARDSPPSVGWIAVFVVLQAARLWVLITLGERWTTRILVRPGAEPIATGPYRWMKHPNYAVVAGEIAVLPLAFGLPWFALIFSALNALVLAVRIRAENAALAAAGRA